MYDVFLSYSHRGDADFARDLKRGLERLGKPWYRRRVLRVFRDDEALASSPALWPSIQGALDDSRWFLLIASPAATESPWVDRELRHFIERHGTSRVLFVLLRGEIAWSQAAGDFDRAATTALPEACFSSFEHEPLWADGRPLADMRLDTRDPRAERLLGQVASALLDRPMDELIGEDRRQHRNSLRLAWGAALLMLALLVAAAIGGTTALRAKDQEIAALQVAGERYLIAYRALDALAEEVQQLDDLPGRELREARQRMLERVFAGFEELVRVSEDAGLEDELAIQSHVTAGDLATDSGRRSDGVRLYRKAREIARRRIDAEPANAGLLAAAIRCELRLSKVVESVVAARRHGRAAGALATRLHSLRPDDESRFLLGTALGSQGESSDILGETTTAASLFAGALQAWEGVGPGEWQRRSEVNQVTTICELARIAIYGYDHAEAKRLCDLADATASRLAREQPGRISVLQAGTWVALQRSKLLEQQGRTDSALQVVDEALARLGPWLAFDPGCIELLLEQQTLLLPRASLAESMLDPDAMREALTQVIDAVDRASDSMEPDMPLLLQNAARAHQRRGLAALARNEVAACMSDLERGEVLCRRLLELDPGNASYRGLEASFASCRSIQARYSGEAEEALLQARRAASLYDALASATGVLSDLKEWCEAAEDLANALDRLGRRDEAQTVLESAIERLRSTEHARPGVLELLHLESSLQLAVSKRLALVEPDRSRAARAAALHASRRMIEIAPDAPEAIESLAGALAASAEHAVHADSRAGEALWIEAVELQQRLTGRFPSVALFRRNLAGYVSKLARVASDPAFRAERLEELERLLGEAATWNGPIATAERIRLLLDGPILNRLEAREYSRVVMDLESIAPDIEDLRAASPSLRGATEVQATLYERLGVALSGLGRPNDALAAYRKGVTAWEVLARESGRFSAERASLMSTRSLAAGKAAELGRLGEAEKELADVFAYYDEWQRETSEPLAIGLWILIGARLSNVQWLAGDREASVTTARRTLEGAERLAGPLRASLKPSLDALEARAQASGG